MPPDPSKAPDAPVVIRFASNEFGAGVLAAKLEANGIPARVVTDDPQGITGMLGATVSRRVALLVPASEAERADELLSELAAQGEDEIDWSTVDVGEPHDELARSIAHAERPLRRTWWSGGWPAAIILLVGGFIALWFSAQAALVIWIAAAIAGVGSTLSWAGARMRRRA